VPNGIDLHKFKKTNPERIRRKYRLDKEKIISLIGITCSESFYFLDSVQFIREAVSQVKFMVVGDSYLIPEMKKHVEKYRDDVIFTGWVDYNEIPDYFAASDVGTYPVEKNVYFDSACPIKVLEYTAAKKPVVSIELEELKLLGFKNIVFSEPNARDFAKNVIKAMNKTFNYPSLSEFDWEKLSQRVENIIYGQLPVK
jgi:glycosyltransferase involved in cell wall biosynthesis